jgi:threonine dehydratase
MCGSMARTSKAPACDVVLVAVGGGALASGVGYAVRSLAEHVEVIGIETIADGVAGRCPIPEVLDDLLVMLDDVMTILCGSNVGPADFAPWVLEPVAG